MAPNQFGGLTRRNAIKAVGAAGAFTLAGCAETESSGGDGGDDGDGGDGGESGDSLSGEVVITGSSTVFPVTDAMAEAFMEEHPEVNVTVDSTGSGGGFENHFCPGDADINGASRPITDGEVDHCGDNGVEPVEFEIARDALTVAINNDNDWVECMTFEELSQIWRDDGAETWADVNDEWPDEPFDLFGPASTSGTYDWFSENVVNFDGDDRDHTADHEPTEEDDLIVQGIRDSRHAMGYFGYAYYNENPDEVTALEVEAEEGDGCAEPSLEGAAEGSYPMARPLFVYANEESLQREEVYEFMRFYVQEAETELVSDIGYVPSNEELVEENLEKLDEAAGN